MEDLAQLWARGDIGAAAADVRRSRIAGGSGPRGRSPELAVIAFQRRHRPAPFVPRTDLAALLEGATLMLKVENRIAALALLWAAVAIAPLDLAAHRRLAAVLANSGDLAGGANEHARYQEFLIANGELGRSRDETAYAAATLGSLLRPRPVALDRPDDDAHDPAVRLARYVSPTAV